MKEREDLQRLLRAHVDVVSPDTLVIAGEFAQFKDSKRRIDLLGRSIPARLDGWVVLPGFYPCVGGGGFSPRTG